MCRVRCCWLLFVVVACRVLFEVYCLSLFVFVRRVLCVVCRCLLLVARLLLFVVYCSLLCVVCLFISA